MYLIIKEAGLLPVHDPAHANVIRYFPRNIAAASTGLLWTPEEIVAEDNSVTVPYPNAEIPPFPVPSGSPVWAMKLCCTLWKSTLL